MQDIKILNRWTGKTIIAGKYESIKDCLQKNRGVNLRDVDLRGVDLRNVDLRNVDLYGADLRNADLRNVGLYGADLRGVDLRGADLRNVDLCGVDLCGVDLRGVDLRGVDLRDANLCGAKNYSESYIFFQEVVRQQNIGSFTQNEWATIGQIIVYKLCWVTIKRRFGGLAMTIFKKLSQIGFGEWENKFKET